MNPLRIHFKVADRSPENGPASTKGKPRTKAPIDDPGLNREDAFLLDEIACVAFERWNQAGRTPGRLVEFWSKADEQLLRARKAGASGRSHSRDENESSGSRRRKTAQQSRRSRANGRAG